MNARDAAHCQAFRRALQCIDRHDELRSVASTFASWTRLHDIVAHISALEARQAYATRHGKELTSAEERLREAARTLIGQVWDIAESEGLQSAERRVFPHPNKNASTGDVILAARASAKLAKVHENVFVTIGLGPTFIADLLDAAAALEAAVADRVDTTGSLRGATEAIPAAVVDGASQLGVLDAVLQRHMNAEMRAEWRAAKRLGRAHRTASRAPAVAPAAAAAAALATPTPPEPTPAPAALSGAASLKALPLVSRLEALVVRLVRRTDTAEQQPVERADVTVHEIRRLPRSTGP